MEPENFTEYSNEDLLQKIKEIKRGKIINATIIGFTVGIFSYSAVKNGFGFFTFFPLMIAYLIVRDSKITKMLEKEIQKELKLRNLL